VTHDVSTPRERELSDNLAAVRARLAAAAEAAGRDVADIDLLAVTKFFPASDVEILSRLGCTAFGESREQEASKKAEEIAAVAGLPPVRWHMIGRIQRNKARAIVRWAYAAHSVDSPKLLVALDRAAAEALDAGTRTEPLRVYIQLSLDADENRGGVDVRRTEEVDALCAAAEAAAGLEFVGLMAIPPLGADADAAFARLEAEHRRVQQSYDRRLELSAGMSGDLELAVRHGSTCVRVGTALLGLRPLPSPPVVTPVTSSSQTPESRQ